MARILGWLACVGAVALLVVAMVTGTGASAAGRPGGDRRGRAAVGGAGRTAAGYFTLAAGGTAVELNGVASPPARIELHGMSMAGDVMRMNTLPSVRVAAGHAVRFAPGGAHLMIFDLPATVKPGATVPLTFALADGTRLRVAAAVVAAGRTQRRRCRRCRCPQSRRRMPRIRHSRPLTAGERALAAAVFGTALDPDRSRCGAAMVPVSAAARRHRPRWPRLVPPRRGRRRDDFAAAGSRRRRC